MALTSQGPRQGPRAVALTFDDGPGAWTPRLLDALKAYDARATFFVLGKFVAGQEALLRRIVAEGHELGNHTFTHRDPFTLTDDELRGELRRAQTAIEQAAGVRPRFARPPYGHDAERFDRVATALDLDTVLWSVDPEDSRHADVERMVRATLGTVHVGAIVGLHDSWPPGRHSAYAREPSVRAVETMLPELRARGYELLTLSELLAVST